MNEIKGYVNLDYCVNRVLSNVDDFNSPNYQKYLQWAINCFGDLQLFTMPSIKIAYIQLDDILQATVPDDYIEYVSIGICKNGKIYTLTLNDNIITQHKTDSCGNPSPCGIIAQTQKDYHNGLWSYIPHFRNGQYVGEQYGQTGGQNRYGYYNIDTKSIPNIIQFNSVVPQTEIVLEYISSGINTDGSAVVPRKCVETIVNFIHYQIAEHGKNISLGEKQWKKNQYLESWHRLDAVNSSFNIDEFLDNQYSSKRGGTINR